MASKPYELRVDGVARVVLWDAAGATTGSHKEVVARSVARAALSDGHRALSVGSCGHYGVAVAAACRDAGLAAYVVMPSTYHGGAAAAAVRLGATIVRSGETYEDAVADSRSLAIEVGAADGNVDGQYEAEVLAGFGDELDRLVTALRVVPDVLVVPTGNGTTLEGMARRAARHGWRTRFVAATSRGNNALASSWPAEYEPIPADALRETLVNEPLCNWDALHGKAALTSIRETGGSVIAVSDDDLIAGRRLIRERVGLDVTEAAAAGVAALPHIRVEPTEVVVALVTARPMEVQPV